MNIVDYILIALLIIFFFKGFRVGLIGALGWIIGLIVGAWAAGHYVQLVAVWLDQWLHNPGLSAVLAFIGILIIVMVIVGWFFWLANKVINFVPFVGLLNRLLGGLLGIIEGVLLLGLIIWFISILPINNSVTTAINNASLKNPLVASTTWIRNLLPDWLKSGSVIDFPRFGLDNPGQFSADDFLKQLTPEQVNLIKDHIDELEKAQ